MQDYDSFKYKEYVVGWHITPSVWHLQKQIRKFIKTYEIVSIPQDNLILMASSNNSLKRNLNIAAA